MKTPLFFRLLLALSVVGVPWHVSGQELPSPGLQLPPLPTLIASAPVVSRPAGLPGGPAPVFVPQSRLTLPEKPSATGLATPLHPAGPAEEPPAPESSGGPDDLFQPGSHPLLPDISAPADGAPDGSPDGLLPSPEAPSAPGFIEIEPAPGDPAAESLPPPADRPRPDSDPDPESTMVLASDLAPAPAKTPESADPKARGPLFRIKGTDAYSHTRKLGYRFTPANGLGLRDGVHTVASQVPNVLTSEVHGTRMMQLRPSALWTRPSIENTFYMFCDASYNAVRLQPGWKIRGIQLKGPNWQWVVCPKSGANTASFSVRIRAWKTVDTPAQGSVVTLEGLTLEGPPGATDWKAAFPSLLRSPTLATRR